MTGSLDREKGLLYDASIHLRFGEGDMDQTGQNIIDAAMELVVERGLAAGEEVVIEGYHKLTPGMKVRATLPQSLTEKKESE